jgi:hypothetical protein
MKKVVIPSNIFINIEPEWHLFMKAATEARAYGST